MHKVMSTAPSVKMESMLLPEGLSMKDVSK